MKVAFIGCSKRKMAYETRVEEMYWPSQLFRGAVKVVKSHHPPYDAWFVLSAKYGLLQPDDVIDPYDLTLKKMGVNARRAWAKMVLRQIDNLRQDSSVFPSPITQATFYCGAAYREFLIPQLERGKVHCEVPIRGMTMGQQLKFYKEKLSAIQNTGQSSTERISDENLDKQQEFDGDIGVCSHYGPRDELNLMYFLELEKNINQLSTLVHSMTRKKTKITI
jgi:hypothetical protein